MREVLLGYDGSTAARHAAAFAADLASRYGAHLHILCVARPPDLGLNMDLEAIVDQQVVYCQNLLSELQEKFGSATEHARMGVAVGHPAQEIVRYAEANDIDHIVVGHRGHSVLDRWLIGSVAREVVAYATCAVTIVRI